MTGHAEANRTVWTGFAGHYADLAVRAWAATEPTWGVWGVAEATLGLVGDIRGLDVLELGCGTAYWSAWLQRAGARPVGLDLTPAQLATARRMQSAYDVSFPLLEADGEVVPLRDGCVDLVLSEYGVSIWCDPYRWVPEAARVLRPGGRLVFLVNSALAMSCAGELGDVGTELRRDWFGMHRFEWPDDHSVEFHLTPGRWITLLRRHGFEIEALAELQPPPDAADSPDLPVPVSWARRWPAEEIWAARLTATGA